MTTTGTCSISFAGTRLAIAWEGGPSFAVLKRLSLTHSVFASHNGVAPDFRLISAETDGSIQLYRGGRLLYEGRSEGTAAVILLDCAVHDLADNCRIGLLFHAAAVSCCGRGILLPGGSGAGKTTLVAWLASRGWNYLTDEIACIERDSMEIQAFYRPLHLKTPIPSSLKHLIPAEGVRLDSENETRVFRGRRGVIIPVEHIHPNNTYHTPEVCLIIFPRYVPTADCELMPLSQAHACARLLGCVVNLRNLPGHGLGQISQLARQVQTYALAYGRLDDLADKIAALLEHHFPPSRT